MYKYNIISISLFHCDSQIVACYRKWNKITKAKTTKLQKIDSLGKVSHL